MEITQDTKNPLLKRREIQFTVESQSNPGFAGTRQMLVEKFKANEESIAVKYVKNNYGTRTFRVEAFIYDTPEDKLRVEQKAKKKKEGSK